MTDAKTKDRRGGPRAGAGRPPANVTLKRAIERLGIDPSEINPERVLAAIAINPDAPATARVAACRTIIDMRRQAAEAAPEPEYNELKWLGNLDDL